MTYRAQTITDDGEGNGRTDLIMFVSHRFGAEMACKIEEAFGGRQVYIPITPEPHNVFPKVVGLENATIIAREFGWGTVMIPLGQRRRSALIEAACLSRRSAGDIAKAFRCSTRWVHQKRANLRRAGRLK
jgi:hypothetical protein